MLSIQSFTFNPFAENSYIVYNAEGDACILDPGCMQEDEEAQLLDFITKQKLTPRRLIQTHSHIDHVLGTAFVSKKFSLVPEIHPDDRVVYESANQTAAMYGLPLKGLPAMKELTAETIELGEDQLEIRFTPGHCPGHIVLICHAQEFVIGGDVLFRGSIGRTDLPGGDFQQLEESIRTQLYTLPESYTVYSGHGPETTIGFEKLNNPFVMP